MDSYIDVEFQQRQHQEESQQPNSGLLRFRSAPSSLFANFRDTIDKDSTAFHNNDKNNKDDKGYANYVNTNQDSETFVSRYISNGGGGGRGDHSSSDLCFDGLETKSLRGMNPADGVVGNSHQLPPQYPKLQHELLSSVSGSIKMAMDYQSGNAVNGSSILARQRSSPAGFFDNPNFHNLSEATVGHTVMNGTGTFSGNYGANDESCPQRTRSRLKGQIDLSCHRSSIGNLPGIPEVRDENSKDTTTDIEHGVESRNGGDEDDARFFGPAGFSFTSWRSDSSYLSEDIPELRGDQHSIDKASSYPVASDASLAQEQDGKLSYCPSRGLSHHLSLPKTSAEVAATDKLIHFQDTVPWKIRAKRGCATHPRSIAERARRTRISERIKKLQDLVPNMDKQMNTADMLDLAVDYIKDLQRQHKALNDLRSSCRCSNV